MADPRRSSQEQRRTGWVWVIVGMVAVALVVWWVAAAVGDGNDSDAVSSIEPTQQEQVRQDQESDEQVFGNGEGELFEEEEDQADRSGQVLGETPTPPSPNTIDNVPADDGEEVEQFTQWSQRQEQAQQEQGQQGQAQVDPQWATEGLQQLDDAVGALVDRYNEPQQGEQAGGGPTRAESNEFQQHRDQLDEAIEQLEEAQQGQQTAAFHEAANTAAQTLQLLQRQAELDQLDQPVEQLQQRVHQIQIDQPLSEQSDVVREFFTQSADIVDQMSQNLQGSQVGGGPTDQQPQQMDSGQ